MRLIRVSLLSVLVALAPSCRDEDPRPGDAVSVEPKTPSTTAVDKQGGLARVEPSGAPGNRFSRARERLARLRAELDELDLGTDCSTQLERVRGAIDELERKCQIAELLEVLKRLPAHHAENRLLDGREPPDINGTVTGVDEDLNIVLVSVGREAGVEVGFSMIVYVEDQYIGKLVIGKIGEHWASGHMDEDLSRTIPRKGTSVTTRL